MTVRDAVAVAALAVCASYSIAATAQVTDEDDDLKRLPAVTQPDTAAASDTQGHGAEQRVHWENALSGWDNRGDLVVPTPIPSPSWQERLSADVDLHWQISTTLKANFSDRLNVYGGDTIPTLSSANLENDLREAFLSDEWARRTYVELGRINLKNGVGYGFNPTDFFKTRSAVSLASIDPAVTREDRLGVVMLETQTLWDGGSASFAYAPKLRSKTPLPNDSVPASADPLLGRTNAEHRALASVTWTGSALNPQALVFLDEIGTHGGLNLSRVLTSSIVVFAEWSGVREADLIDRAEQFGVETGVFPAGLPVLLGASSAKTFRNDAATGLSWTSSNNVTLTAEYDYHGSGLSNQDFSQWLSTGSGNPQQAARLWYLRAYASDQIEPFMQHEVFLRADWQDVMPSKLNLGAVAFVATRDGSTLMQLSAQYFVSRRWTVSGFLGVTVGSVQSVFGSLPWRSNAIVQVMRYL